MTDRPATDPSGGSERSSPADRPSTTGTALLHRLLRGDEGAFRILVRRHHPGMLRVARGFVRTDSAAEEVAQQTWLAVLEGLPRYEARSSLKSWIFSILVNLARRRGVQDQRHHRTVDPSVTLDGSDGRDPEPRPWVAKGGGPEGELLATELRRRVEIQVATLPRKQRLVLILRDIQGWPSEDVCELLCVTPGHQRVLLHRARLRIRAALAPYLDSPTDRENHDDL